MNLKVDINGIKLEIQNGDLNRVEKTLLALFAHVEGGSFCETYNATHSEERPVGSHRNYVETVDGVKELNGTKLYQCAYRCSCGNSGKRFVKEDATTTTCHKCNSELSVVPSTDDDAHDEEFNYFIAY